MLFHQYDENSDSFEKHFCSDHIKLKDAFLKVGDPFEEQPLINLVVKIVVSPDSVESVRIAYAIGDWQSVHVVNEHLIRKSVSLYDNIKLNKVFLFSQRIELKPSRTGRAATLLKTDCRLFANFYVTCQSRAGDLENFFAHENQAFPVSLSEYGKLHNRVKSDFIDCQQNL